MSEQLDLIAGGICARCERQHFDGNWLICDDCDDSLRAWLKWHVPVEDWVDIVGVLTARRMWGAS